jgi:pyruvate formate lyase activating enzyme
MIARSNTIGVAYTYSEPVIWYETIMEIGPRVRSLGLKNVMVTNGFIEPAPLKDLLSTIDAMNIDIKSMNSSFYRRICKGALEPVLKTCEAAKKAGCHLEITHLLIPGENDDPGETAALAGYMAENLGSETPLHLSRYFPRYRMTHSPTSPGILEHAWEIARKKLDYVYVGNMASEGKEHTYCPGCGELLISRRGYTIHRTGNLIKAPDSRTVCRSCNRLICIVI